MMAMPWDFSRRTSSKSASTSCLASEAVGSSMMSTLASCPNALAISVSCHWAVESAPTSAAGSIATPMRASSSAARDCMARSSMRPPRVGSVTRKMFCATVRVLMSENSWNTMPTPAARAAWMVVACSGVPNTSTEPASRG
jgi:hypothetical protein